MLATHSARAASVSKRLLRPASATLPRYSLSLLSTALPSPLPRSVHCRGFATAAAVKEAATGAASPGVTGKRVPSSKVRPGLPLRSAQCCLRSDPSPHPIRSALRSCTTHPRRRSRPPGSRMDRRCQCTHANCVRRPSPMTLPMLTARSLPSFSAAFSGWWAASGCAECRRRPSMRCATAECRVGSAETHTDTDTGTAQRSTQRGSVGETICILTINE